MKPSDFAAENSTLASKKIRTSARSTRRWTLAAQYFAKFSFGSIELGDARGAVDLDR